MEKMNIVFLGTGNAIPTELRNHSGILVNFLNESILIDCGEGIQRQFKKAKLSPSKLTKIFISHWHGDHVLGLPGLFQTLAMSNYEKTLEIYGPVGTSRFINLIKELILNINIKLKVIEINSPGIFLDKKEFCFAAEKMSHGIDSLAYSIILKDKIRLDKKKLKKFKIPNSPLLKHLAEGKDIKINNKTIKASQIVYKEKGKKITIVMDTLMNNNAISLAKNADILITESTFSKEEEKKAKEYRHLTASQAATIAKKANAKKLVLTHISQRYEHNLKKIEKEAKKIFKNSSIAKDLDVFNL